MAAYTPAEARLSRKLKRLGVLMGPKAVVEFSASVGSAGTRFDMVEAAEAAASNLKQKGVACSAALLLEAAASQRGRRHWRTLAAAMDKAEKPAQGTRTNMEDILRSSPLKALVSDPAVRDIMVSGPARVFAEMSGRMCLSDVVFRDEDEIGDLCRALSCAAGRKLDAEHPIVDAVFPNGDTIAIVTRPISIDGTNLTVRRDRNGRPEAGAVAQHGPPRTPGPKRSSANAAVQRKPIEEDIAAVPDRVQAGARQFEYA